MENIQDTVRVSAEACNCPNCGADLCFDADKQKLTCRFCLSEFTEEELDETDIKERSAQKRQNDQEFCDHMDEYVCPNCGAEIIADEATSAGICIYCHSPVILKGKLSGQMQPNKIVPFKYGKEEASNKFKKFIKNKWFLPSDFRSSKHADQISGIYYPFWVTDADVNASMNAEAKNLRVWTQGNYRYTETSVYACERNGDIHFEDIVTCAFSKAEKEMLEGILPYPSHELIDYSSSYLSGFLAKKRDIERESLSDEVKEKMNEYSVSLLKDTVIGYSSVKPTSNSLNIHKSHWEYSLLPIWMLTYNTPKKTYIYAMNGCTGKIYGELPISFKKLAVALTGIFAVLAPIFYMIGGLFL